MSDTFLLRASALSAVASLILLILGFALMVLGLEGEAIAMMIAALFSLMLAVLGFVLAVVVVLGREER